MSACRSAVTADACPPASVFCDLLLGFTLAFGCLLLTSQMDAACVWKVTGPNGGTLFLGGSVHVLRSVDYPLPAAYNRAFEASSRIVFEANPKDLLNAAKGITKAGQYPRGDSLKNHVDPRTYEYVRHFFSLLKVPEAQFVRFRPWFIELMLERPPPEYSTRLGVEEFLTRRARANSKPISGLESLREGVDLFSKIGDRESEALLLLMFIHAGQQDPHIGDEMLNAWRRGDAESLARAHAYFVPRFAGGWRTSNQRTQSQLDSKTRALYPQRPNILCRCGCWSHGRSRGRYRLTQGPRLPNRRTLAAKRDRTHRRASSARRDLPTLHCNRSDS